MRRSKPEIIASLFRINAEAFAVVPELIFLMESKVLWDRIEKSIKATSQGLTMDSVIDFPIEQLCENLQALRTLVNSRHG